MDFREELSKRILIGDGAMGTLLYSTGIDHCFEELNIISPDKIEQIHKTYVASGSDIIQTNTYGANYYKLKRYGLEDEVQQINRQGVIIARKAANNQAFVFGTIGASRGLRKNDLDLSEIKRQFREQLYALLLEDPDGILLETYYDLEEIEAVLAIVKEESNLPIIANICLHDMKYLQNGMHVSDALIRLEQFDVEAVGLNCRLGPHHMIRSLEEVPIPQKSVLSVYPNASLPDFLDGKLTYEPNPDYFGSSAIQLVEQGARIIGGCCGTTPLHIESVKKALAGKKPVLEKIVKPRKIEIYNSSFDDNGPSVLKKGKTERTILVELDPPKKLGISDFLQGAKALISAGADTLTLADNSLASPRICNVSLSSILQDKQKIKPIVHITCRDRNLIGLQSHLMGLHTLGLNEVLAVTGDPSKIGDFPGATSVYDLSSFDLIGLIKQFNEGRSYSGQSLGQKTNFHVAAAFNPNVRYLHKAVERMEKKIACGADSFITQPIFSIHQLEELHEATKHIDAPIYIGIMPLTSYKNAEFLHHEVPGIQLTDQVRKAMFSAGNDRRQAEIEGLAIAKELIDAALEKWKSIYLITPFMRYGMTVNLTEYIRDKDKQELKEERQYASKLT
ncbi:bifunctional homocysteine S-methyltransferase/methylenetetrahydrofolate reductase [Peribacillus alkalitolerans]|uniref:bifunctional homocysteine S-methyltransferase/methylenetetrahydrofolate reductase n=1 Tax=Peribacillus alkalitolerans TaxID=1550385 RepID=UPI0013D33DF4|nr:bifunctional homocysteine S-methyltransferase/methylenetetrahydrofolate reductase [Peribacillus alkalitolerans]